MSVLLYVAKGEILTCARRNMIIGSGKVNSRKVYVTADDFSVRGGHADGGIQGKAAFGEVRLSKEPELGLTSRGQHRLSLSNTRFLSYVQSAS